MKHIILFTLFLFPLTLSVLAQDEADSLHTINVHISGFSSDNGKAFIGVYDTEGNWLSKKYVSKIEEISNKVCAVTFTDIPYGTYAVSMFHDENDNGKMDTGIFGIPKEDYACSNGAKGRFGPPKWKDAKFVTTTQSIEILIKI